MNIRVDLNTSIKDGTEVVFRSPVDCSQVTGLKVYYIGADGNTTSQEFVFADAHGNNVGDIPHLFTENVAVKVILDVTTGMAFVQNADTNAYLESRFDGIIDKLCPSFTESGAIVTCEPLEGTPLEVISEIPYTEPSQLESVTLTRRGKNLIPQPYAHGTKVMNGIAFTVNDDFSITMNGTATGQATFGVMGKGTKLNGQSTADMGLVYGEKYTISVSTPLPSGMQLQTYFYDEVGGSKGSVNIGSAGTSKTFTFSADYAYFYSYFSVSSGTTLNNFTVCPMIERGEVATEYEPYRKETYTANLSEYNLHDFEGTYNWTTGALTNNADGTEIQLNPQPMPAFKGTNAFMSSATSEVGVVAINPNDNDCRSVALLDDEFMVEVYCEDFVDPELIDTSVAPTILNPNAGGGNWTAEWWSGGTDVKLHSPPFDYEGDYPEYPRFTIRTTNNTTVDTTVDSTVKGKKDPVKVIERLEATVNALLGG